VTSARYRVEFAPTAQRGLDRLPEKAATAAIEFCFGPLADNPQRVGRRLTRELAGRHAARRGEYRVIYRIDEGSRVVEVLRVEHRRISYRPPG
jgi:mRNA-degrading endonuclease RelE of RelBE toxin-antitoxin system